MHVGSCNGPCLNVLDWQGFGPAGEVVDNCEEVFETLGLRERTDQIDVNVVESPGSWFELLERSLGMGLDFHSLAA